MPNLGNGRSATTDVVCRMSKRMGCLKMPYLLLTSGGTIVAIRLSICLIYANSYSFQGLAQLRY